LNLPWSPKTPRGSRYGWPQFLGDCSGGMIAALIALPYGLAMASLMKLPPVLGVFTSILTAPVIALLGRNPVLIGGTASATVPFLALAVRNQGIGGAAKVCMVASVIMMGFCVVRLGRHIARVPHAVVSGFSCGIGGMMLVSQLDVCWESRRRFRGQPARHWHSSPRSSAAGPPFASCPSPWGSP
jgi:SulP family sulfate permease